MNRPTTPQTQTLAMGPQHLEVLDLPAPSPGRPPLVLLHEGLGSVAMWRDFPQRLSQHTGARVVAYSRQGYGQSSPITSARQVDYMHHEALNVLPAVLEALHVDRPVLLGHSDGASIALIHAGHTTRPLAGVVALAPHLMVETVSVDSIARARHAYETTDLRQRLARYHADVDGAFWGWNRIWLHPDFRSWNIEADVARIRCPVLAIQGHDDEYGTMEQIDRIARLCPGTERLKLPNCGHSPHKDQPDAVLAAVARLVAQLA